MKKWILMGLVSVLVLIMSSGCENLMGKAVGISNSTSGFYLQTTASAETTSLPAPTIWIARNQISLATAPVADTGKQSQPVFTMSSSRSFFGSLFGVDDSGYTLSYIGTIGETSKETAERLEAIAKVKATSFKVTSNTLTESAVADSSINGQ